MSDTLTLFHGTCTAFLKHIKAKGLKPCHGHGADSWARHNGHSGIADRTAHHAPSVFVTSERAFADQFAYIVAHENNSKPLVLELAVPRDAFAEQFKADEADDPFMQFLLGHPVAFRSERPVPAEWIKHTHRVTVEEVEPV